MTLYAEPTEGAAPLTVAFVGKITGGPSVSPELYCQNETWNFGEGQIISVFGLCLAWQSGSNIQRSFQRTNTYEKPGVYEATFIYGPLKSEPVLITVTEYGRRRPG